MAPNRLTKLSKMMSFVLRHQPETVGLTLDPEGMVPLSALLAALQQQPGYAWVREADIRTVVTTSDKQRFHLEGDRIGARYGHNQRIPDIDPGPPIAPPDRLYHGTPRRAIPAILAQGLRPQSRQFVHLAATPATAHQVGARRDDQPAILIIHARAAHQSGIPFYAPTPETYLTPAIPPHFIEVQGGIAENNE